MNRQVMKFRNLVDEMKAVAQGQQAAVKREDRNAYASQTAHAFARKIQGQKADRAVSTSNPVTLNITSLAAVTRLISRENQELLQIIAQGEVTSLAELAAKTRRAESNLSRTLKKLETIGVLELVPGLGRAKVPKLSVASFKVEINVVTGEVHMVSARQATPHPVKTDALHTHRVPPNRTEQGTLAAA